MGSWGQAVSWGILTQVQVQDFGLQVMSGGLIRDTRGSRQRQWGSGHGTQGWNLWAVAVGGRATGDLGSQNRPQEEEEEEEEENPGQTWLVHTRN